MEEGVLTGDSGLPRPPVRAGAGRAAKIVREDVAALVGYALDEGQAGTVCLSPEDRGVSGKTRMAV
jgi:hypothetical protein